MRASVWNCGEAREPAFPDVGAAALYLLGVACWLCSSVGRSDGRSVGRPDVSLPASWDSTYRWYPLYFKVLIHHGNSYQAAELAAVTLQWSCERKRSQPAPWRSFASRASRAHRVCIHNRQGPNQHALWNVWRRQESRVSATRRCERRIHT